MIRFIISIVILFILSSCSVFFGRSLQGSSELVCKSRKVLVTGISPKETREAIERFYLERRKKWSTEPNKVFIRTPDGRSMVIHGMTPAEAMTCGIRAI